MNKNVIKQYLSNTFLTEASDSSTPAIALAKKIKKENGKENKAGIKAIADDLDTYEKDSKKQAADQKEMPQNKFNAEGEEITYHNEMEIMNGQEMVQYDGEPNKDFKDRALEAIEGSSRMGNNPEWANVVTTGWGADPKFGEKLVKRIKDSAKKRSKQTPKTKMFGDDWEVVPDTGHKPYAVESKSSSTKGKINEDVMADKNYTHFAIDKKTGKIMNAWNYSDVDKEELKANPTEYFFNDLNDMADTFAANKINKKDVSIITRKALDTKKINPEDINNWYRPKYQDNQTQPEAGEINKVDTQIKESMKRLKFKKEFNGVGNALKLIPETYRVDKKVFEMTDGNESYQIRWEGSLTEGKAVVLTAANNKMVNEDIQRMKQLFNYKSSETLGTVKGQARIDENKAFTDVWNKTKALMEEKDIEDAEVGEGEWEDINIPQAPEAKKHIEGTTSTDKGTKAPKPKTGEWEKISKPQAPEAKKHVEGTASTDKGTKAPKPKEGEWDKAKTGQAPEAKKDIKEDANKKKVTPTK